MDEAKWASGRWQVKEGMADEFVERWKTWLGWTSQNIPGFRSATLLRSQEDPLRFTSISEWDDDATLKAWKTSPGFGERFELVKAVCDEFLGGDFDMAAGFSGPSAVRD